jgi:uncharacterized Zn-finger protein
MEKFKWHKCDFRDCEKLFSTKYSLKRHIMKHSNKKRHICKHCQKGFTLPQYLEEHEYTHTGEKPFVCGVGECIEVFRQRGKLSIHRKNIHPEFQIMQSLMDPPHAPPPLFADRGAFSQIAANPSLPPMIPVGSTPANLSSGGSQFEIPRGHSAAFPLML